MAATHWLRLWSFLHRWILKHCPPLTTNAAAATLSATIAAARVAAALAAATATGGRMVAAVAAMTRLLRRTVHNRSIRERSRWRRATRAVESPLPSHGPAEALAQPPQQ